MRGLGRGGRGLLLLWGWLLLGLRSWLVVVIVVGRVFGLGGILRL